MARRWLRRCWALWRPLAGAARQPSPLGAARAAHACLFRAWGAAPNASGVVCWYLLRLGIVFGAVVLALFVPFADALGVLVPQLFCLPVLAVRLALEKKEP